MYALAGGRLERQEVYLIPEVLVEIGSESVGGSSAEGECNCCGYCVFLDLMSGWEKSIAMQLC